MGGSGGGVEEHQVLLDIEHVQQSHTWDCGLACIMMILPEHARDLFSAQLYQICEEEGFDKRKLTDCNALQKRCIPPRSYYNLVKKKKQLLGNIGACHPSVRGVLILPTCCRGLGFKHRYVTVTLGVDPGFSSESFYNHVLSKDAQRVLDRFREANSQGVVVEQGGVALSEILTHLCHKGPVILLTNAHLLVCERCAKTIPQLRSCLPCSPSYQGHYILLIGYDLKKNLVYYRNPSFKNRICTIGFSKLDKARQSYGTDEDVIFIYTHSKAQVAS